MSFSSFGYNIASKGDSLRAFEITHSLQNYSFKNLVEKTINENVTVNLGGELQLYFVNPGEQKAPQGSELTPFSTQTERGLEYGLFAGAEFIPFERLKLETGVRLAGYLSLADGQKNIYKEGLPITEDNLIETVETDINSIEKSYIHLSSR